MARPPLYRQTRLGPAQRCHTPLKSDMPVIPAAYNALICPRDLLLQVVPYTQPKADRRHDCSQSPDKDFDHSLTCQLPTRSTMPRITRYAEIIAQTSETQTITPPRKRERPRRPGDHRATMFEVACVNSSQPETRRNAFGRRLKSLDRNRNDFQPEMWRNKIARPSQKAKEAK